MLSAHVDVPALLRAGAPRVISCYSVASSVVELVNSGLCEFDVAGFGTVAFPLTQAKAVKLVRSAKLASYGHVDNSADAAGGTARLVDPAVRKTWQVSPDRVALPRVLFRAISQIVTQAKQSLGVKEVWYCKGSRSCCLPRHTNSRVRATRSKTSQEAQHSCDC